MNLKFFSFVFLCKQITFFAVAGYKSQSFFVCGLVNRGGGEKALLASVNDGAKREGRQIICSCLHELAQFEREEASKAWKGCGGRELSPIQLV